MIPSTPQAAVSIIETKNKVLLLKRQENINDPWSGHWALPGGHREKNDTTLLETAIRETEEETSIKLLPCHHHATLPHTLAGKVTAQHPILVAPFVFQLPATPAVYVQTTEVAYHTWVDINYLQDKTSHVQNAHIPRYSTKPISYIPLDNTPLWGFTYKVLCSYYTQ